MSGTHAARRSGASTSTARVVRTRETTGPFCAGGALREEVDVTGLAVGAFGEASDDVQKLLGFVATTGAAERWRGAMAPSPLLGYRSVLVAQLRRVWVWGCCFFARENAQLELAEVDRYEWRCAMSLALRRKEGGTLPRDFIRSR